LFSSMAWIRQSQKFQLKKVLTQSMKLMLIMKYCCFIIMSAILIACTLRAEDSIPSKDTGLCGIEFSIGGVGCIKSGLLGTEENLRLIQRGNWQGQVELSYTYKRACISLYGQGLLSSELAPEGDFEKGDTIIIKSSWRKIGNDGINIKWRLFDFSGITVQPLVGFRNYYVEANINARLKSTGDTFRLVDGFRKSSSQCGFEAHIPIWDVRKGGKNRWGIQFSLDPKYYYSFNAHKVSMYGGRLYLNLNKGISPDTEHMGIFLNFFIEKGVNLHFRHLLLGLQGQLPPKKYFSKR